MRTSRSTATKAVTWLAILLAVGACSAPESPYDYRNGYSTVYTGEDENAISPLSLTGHMYY